MNKTSESFETKQNMKNKQFITNSHRFIYSIAVNQRFDAIAYLKRLSSMATTQIRVICYLFFTVITFISLCKFSLATNLIWTTSYLWKVASCKRKEIAAIKWLRVNSRQHDLAVVLSEQRLLFICYCCHFQFMLIQTIEIYYSDLILQFDCIHVLPGFSARINLCIGQCSIMLSLKIKSNETVVF